MTIHHDCRYFRGYIPCKIHKEKGVHCDGCSDYAPIEQRILIIKLGAAGDVIRTTPLLERLKREYPHSFIYWLTYSPELLPESVDRIMSWNSQNLLILEETPFDIVINLDKDHEACALAKRLDSKKLHGFTFENGVPVPANKLAEHKYITGLFDDISRKNTKSYPEEIFEICGFKFSGERYKIRKPVHRREWDFPTDKKVIGLNTGCGGRWTSRLWKEERWVELASMLSEKGYYPLLLGGPEEDERNRRIHKSSGAHYPGHFSLGEFIHLMDQCDLVVTAVTMAMHIAIALGKKLVLFNNIFNPAEFELYGQGTILQPEFCECYYVPQCDKDCMSQITAAMVFSAIEELLAQTN